MADEKHYNLFFLNDYFDNDLSAILPILEMYIEETPKELAVIESSLIKNDAPTSKAITHKIKTNISMLGIRDQSTFINDMHLLRPSDNIHDSIREQFGLFKATVTQAINEIREDFFTKEIRVLTEIQIMRADGKLSPRHAITKMNYT